MNVMASGCLLLDVCSLKRKLFQTRVILFLETCGGKRRQTGEMYGSFSVWFFSCGSSNFGFVSLPQRRKKCVRKYKIGFAILH